MIMQACQQPFPARRTEGLEVLTGSEVATAHQSTGQDTEPLLDRVQPGGVLRGGRASASVGTRVTVTWDHSACPGGGTAVAIATTASRTDGPSFMVA